MKFTHVKGKNKGRVTFYAISTCMWCQLTKDLLDELKVEYHFIYVDLQNKTDKKKIIKEVKKWKKTVHFPLIVIDNKKAITSYDEDRIRKELG